MLYLADIFFRFEPGCHHLMTASHTPQAKIRAGSQHFPAFFATGVGLFHYKNII